MSIGEETRTVGPRASSAKPMKHTAQVRVLYADTDQMGVANYVQYLRWFEVGRAEWVRARGYTYKQIEKGGALMPVIEAHARYREPARYDDLLDVVTAPQEVKAASVKFVYELRRADDGALLCEGYTIHACITTDGKVRRFPPELLEMLGGGTK